MRQASTKELARGKWVALLTDIIGPDAVKRKHGPCPMCGGQDRYRFDNKNGNGDWYCNQCGVGDGFKLIERTLGLTFRETAKMIDRYLKTNPVEDDKPFKEVINIAKRREHLNQLWGSAKQPDILINYLTGRGIPMSIIEQARDLRGVAEMPDWDTGTTWPGMVAMIRNKRGEPVSIHRTYIGMDKARRKRIMPAVETIAGACVRLGEVGDTLLVAEGIETALTGWALLNTPAWALISAQNMETFDGIPGTVKRVIVCADHDLSFTGQAAAFKLAARLKNQRQLEVEVHMPVEPGHDVNDTWQAQGDLYGWGAPPLILPKVWGPA